MARVSGISHFAIKVRDLDAAERFYEGVLGLRVERRWPAETGGGLRSLWMATGDAAGTFLALERADPGAGAADLTAGVPLEAEADHPPGHYLLALRIAADQRSAFEARLQSAGVTVSHQTAFSLYFRDPEGNRLALSHYPDPAPSTDSQGR